ncbi:hypothetical protein NE237_014196 [Protea cynaroides]|uniref:Uncharacterized protein n=1 Tax=Protea cynaroides TaxID=273540 RepID=A0A9Q0GKR3_9MAGN|nr:hypothetical protein NE237_014196 [Protea cynaroides]
MDGVENKKIGCRHMLQRRDLLLIVWHVARTCELLLIMWHVARTYKTIENPEYGHGRIYTMGFMEICCINMIMCLNFCTFCNRCN